MNPPDTQTGRSARRPEPIGKAALIASVGGTRGYADWTNPDHRVRRLLSEFIGMAGRSTGRRDGRGPRGQPFRQATHW